MLLAAMTMENPMKYMILIYSNESGWASLTPAQKQQGMQAYLAYSEALEKAGAVMASHRLQPVASATTVRVSNGKTQVLNGPYADSKEQLGGYFLIDAPDLDSAIAWASRCPGAASGAIEVRPVWDMQTP